MITAISYGGGVQSTALIVLAVTGRIHADVAIFANTGDDSENPDTLTYVRTIATPYATDAGLKLVELTRTMRNGTTRTLLDEIRHQPRSIPIPVRMGGGGFGRKRCTDRFKIAVIRRELQRRGATTTTSPTGGSSLSKSTRWSVTVPSPSDQLELPL